MLILIFIWLLHDDYYFCIHYFKILLIFFLLHEKQTFQYFHCSDWNLIINYLFLFLCKIERVCNYFYLLYLFPMQIYLAIQLNLMHRNLIYYFFLFQIGCWNQLFCHPQMHYFETHSFDTNFSLADFDSTIITFTRLMSNNGHFHFLILYFCFFYVGYVHRLFVFFDFELCLFCRRIYFFLHFALLFMFMLFQAESSGHFDLFCFVIPIDCYIIMLISFFFVCFCKTFFLFQHEFKFCQ